jgi:Domain of unknown function (DUF4129)
MASANPIGMWHFRLACLVLCFSLSAPGARAQEVAAQPLEIKPSGEAYLKSLGYRGIDTDVGYYDPTGALPALDTQQEPAKPPQVGDAETDITPTARIVTTTLAAAVLIGVLLLFLKFGGGLTLSMEGDVQNPARSRRLRGQHALADIGPPADLQAILRTSDRRKALVMLVQAALARTVTANGVLLQPSWTMRDTLRHIPKGQAHLDALRSLVMAGERVLFGNRDVTEEEFQAHVATVRPLMTGPAA